MTSPHDPQIAQVLMGIGELKTSVAVLDTKLTTIETTGTDHEKRIRGLERFRFMLVGAGALAGGLASWLIQYLSNIHH